MISGFDLCTLSISFTPIHHSIPPKPTRGFSSSLPLASVEAPRTFGNFYAWVSGIRFCTSKVICDIDVHYIFPPFSLVSMVPSSALGVGPWNYVFAFPSAHMAHMHIKFYKFILIFHSQTLFAQTRILMCLMCWCAVAVLQNPFLPSSLHYSLHLLKNTKKKRFYIVAHQKHI